MMRFWVLLVALLCTAAHLQPCACSSRASSSLLTGRWELVAANSSELPLWSSFEVDIDAEGAERVDLVFTWKAGEADDFVEEQMSLALDGQPTDVPVTCWVQPYNIFEALTLYEGDTKTVVARMNAERTVLDLTINFTQIFSQGSGPACQLHHFEAQTAQSLLYTVAPLSRAAPYRYVLQPGARAQRTQEAVSRLPSRRQVKVVPEESATASGQWRGGNGEQRELSFVPDPQKAFFMKLDNDWEMSSALPQKLLLLSLQGLVNRDGPVLYFKYPDEWAFTYTNDVFDFYAESKKIEFSELQSAEDAVRELAPGRCKGYVVFDENVRTSVMVSFTLGGLEDALVVSGELVPLMEEIKLPMVRDFRGQFTNMSDVDVYSWAYEQYGARCNDSLAVWLGGVCGDRMEAAIADWGIQNRAFVCDLSSRTTAKEEYALASHILSKLKPYSMVMGWHSYCKDLERTWVKLTSSYTHRVEGLNSLPNLSFSSRVLPEPGFKFKNQHNIVPGRIYKPEKKTYISAVQTDGIGLGAWTKPGRGSMPYAWEVTMNYLWAAPAMLEYFYLGATPNDYFVGSLGGPGYCYPKACPADKLPGLLSIANSMMKALDLDSFEVMDYSEQSYSVNGTNNLPKEVVAAYYSSMPDAIGFINGYAPSYTFTCQDQRPFVSFDYYLSGTRSDEDAIDDLRELAKLNSVRPYYLLMHVREFGDVTRTKRILDKLGGDFELVPLDLFLKYAGYEPTFKEHFEPS